MNLHDLLLNVKAVSFEQLIPQTEIQAEEDKERYAEHGYNVFLTESEFREKFDLDPSCVWYTPSISNSCLYFNEETLAVSSFPMEMFIFGRGLDKDSFYKVIHNREAEAAQKEFAGCLLSLPDAMRLEYFELIVDNYGADVPELYNLFFSNYRAADYGFNHMDPSTLDVVLSAKTDDDAAKTEAELRDLPDKIKIYRGGNTQSTPYTHAYSWTLDINVANYFACRLGSGTGYLVEGEVDKKDVIEAFLSDTDEKEIFVDPQKVKILSEIEIRGQDALAGILPSITPTFHRYREKMYGLDFARASEEHGYAHEARVLLMSLTIAHLLKLPDCDKRVLAEAAIYHDTQRVNDDVDLTHGRASREYYRSSVASPDPLVEFLCEYHCLPDEDGLREIEENPVLNKNMERAARLFRVFKDSDSLDRVRFGIKELDVKQLRLPVSKELGLIARMYVNQVRIDVPQKARKRSLSDRIQDAEAKSADPFRRSRSIVQAKNKYR